MLKFMNLSFIVKLKNSFFVSGQMDDVLDRLCHLHELRDLCRRFHRVLVGHHIFILYF